MRPLLPDLGIHVLDVPHTEYLPESGEGLALEGDIGLFIVKSNENIIDRPTKPKIELTNKLENFDLVTL